MSLLLVLFYFIGIPALVIAAAVWLWRRSESSLAQGLVMVGAIATLAGLLWLAQGETWQADKQVRELCAKDGGVRVYETVTLPAEMFDEQGRPNFQVPTKSKSAATDKYFYETNRHYYKQGHLNLLRTQHRIVRRSDGQVLGELIRYGRSGGGLPGPWSHSSFMCPDPVKQRSNLEADIFVKGDSK